jgi:iron complex outermembrane receptor protein
MKMLSKKPALVLMLTMSTASFYFAQSTQDTLSKDTSIDEVVLTGVADIAKDRKTPVAVSTIKEAQIVEKMGNQEFPEILNTTPSVYATKGGGGFGDGKTVIRGFTQENIAVMVNGMPVNDMENGAVYWSNWSGLSDVTSSMQVQRGLGSSKLAIASVGGTINILTRAADKKEGAVVSVGVGNDDFHKSLFSYNSGKNANGWATSFLMSRTAGSMYADGTQFEGYNYYWALGYQTGKHDFQFTITGAPQWHNQRSTYSSIQNYIKYNDDNNGEPNRRYNPDWGYRNGEVVSNRVNYYHKPVMSLNWDWKISEKSKLNSIFYASFGRGGGTGDLGRIPTGVGTATGGVTSFVTPDGQINYDAIAATNAKVNLNTPASGNTLIRRASVNSHNWYGAIISFNHKINDNLNFTLGTDNRYYYGYHYQVASDLYGAAGYKDNTNKNFYTNPGNVYTATPRLVTNTFAPKPNWNPFGGKINDTSDMIGFDNDGEVLWYGGFGQLEYSNDRLSAFVSGALSNQSFQRIDHFIIDGVSLLNTQQAGFINSTAANSPVVQATALNPALNTKTGFKDILGYNAKAGANYNIDDHNNVFANIGYYSKQPFLNAVYPGNKNYLNPNLTNEKIFGIEAGYGFRSGIFNANVNVYRTSWKDRFQRRSNISLTYPDPTNPANTISTTTAYANIEGITEIHQGAELEVTANVHKMLTLTGMISYGDYYYKGNASGNQFTESNEQIGTDSQTLYLDKVKVGGTAQKTAAVGFIFKPTDWVSLDANYRGAKDLYSNLTLTNFGTERAGQNGALELPSFGLVDLGLTFRIKLNDPKQFFTLRGNVYNLLDKTYISESNTNILNNLTQEDFKTSTGANDTAAFAAYQATPTWNGVKQSNQVYFGYGRTWAATLSFNF